MSDGGDGGRWGPLLSREVGGGVGGRNYSRVGWGDGRWLGIHRLKSFRFWQRRHSWHIVSGCVGGGFWDWV